MTVLNILDENGELMPNADIRIAAAMKFPDAPKRQYDILCAAQFYKVDGSPIPSDIAKRADPVIQAIVRETEDGTWSGERKDWTDIDHRGFQGEIVGETLINLRRLDQYANEYALLGMAQALVWHNRQGQKGTSQKSIRTAWDTLKNATPLWAAFHINTLNLPDNMDDRLLVFLAIAKDMATFAMGFMQKYRWNDYIPLLNESTLLPPDSLELPHVEIELPALSHDELLFVESHHIGENAR